MKWSGSMKESLSRKKHNKMTKCHQTFNPSGNIGETSSIITFHTRKWQQKHTKTFLSPGDCICRGSATMAGRLCGRTSFVWRDFGSCTWYAGERDGQVLQGDALVPRGWNMSKHVEFVVKVKLRSSMSLFSNFEDEDFVETKRCYAGKFACCFFSWWLSERSTQPC